MVLSVCDWITYIPSTSCDNQITNNLHSEKMCHHFFPFPYQLLVSVCCINFSTFQLAVSLVTVDANGLAAPFYQRSSYGIVAVPLSTYI
jgi:hypothetical protein